MTSLLSHLTPADAMAAPAGGALTAARADVSADDVERKARLPGGRTALAAFRKRSACADVACAGRRVRRWCAKALPLQQRMRRSWPRRLRRWLQVTQVSRSTSSAVAGQSVRWSTCCCICRRRSCRKNTARVAPVAQSGPRRPLRLRLRRRKTLPSCRGRCRRTARRSCRRGRRPPRQEEMRPLMRCGFCVVLASVAATPKPLSPSHVAPCFLP